MAQPQGVAWQQARVESIRQDTPTVKSFALRPAHWRPFRPGQHFDVRLTAPDGYQAQRSYSVASAPESEGVLELTIEIMPGGEVSPYFHDVVVPGDAIELRGPIGGPFTWSVADGGPLLLLGGGSGVVPLMAMLRHRMHARARPAACLVYSARSLKDVIYREELAAMSASDSGFEVVTTLTRSAPPGWVGPARRIDRAMIQQAIDRLVAPARVYCCGSGGFVEAAANLVVAAGVEAAIIRTERFGPTGA